MKKLNLIVVSLVVLLFSCKKDEVRPETLIGSWELRHVSGGQVEGEQSSRPEGNGSVIRFSDREYQQIQDGKVISSRTYKIAKESAEIDGTKYKHRIVFDGDEWKVFIKISGNELLICSGERASDGSTLTYRKL